MSITFEQTKDIHVHPKHIVKLQFVVQKFSAINSNNVMQVKLMTVVGMTWQKTNCLEIIIIIFDN